MHLYLIVDSNDVATVDGVMPTQEQQNAFDEIMASCTEVQTYSGSGDLTESASSYTFSVKIAADLSAGDETFDVQVEALFSITIGEEVSKYVFPYLEIGGFSHRWPPLDVLRHEQPEVLNFGDCERLSSFCHHFSDRLKQFITLNPVVLPCEGEE